MPHFRTLNSIARKLCEQTAYGAQRERFPMENQYQSVGRLGANFIPMEDWCRMALTNLGTPTARLESKGSTTRASATGTGMAGMRVDQSKSKLFTKKAKSCPKPIGPKTVSKQIRRHIHQANDRFWPIAAVHADIPRGALNDRFEVGRTFRKLGGKRPPRLRRASRKKKAAGGLGRLCQTLSPMNTVKYRR